MPFDPLLGDYNEVLSNHLPYLIPIQGVPNQE